MYYSEVVRARWDAGIYREYIVQNWGSILVYGGTYNSYRMALGHCNKLAKIIGKLPQQVVNDIKNDYSIMER